MKHLLSLCTTALAATLVACGGNDDPAPHIPSAPQLRLHILDTQDYPGSFGDVGAYERVSGVLSGEIDPRDTANAIIQDLALAPVNARGMVEYEADFVMLKPKDMARASGVLRYDAPNRGNILTMPDLANAPSDALYFERGYVMLYSAWQGDVPKSSAQRLTVQVPTARNPDGTTVTGSYRTELIPAAAAPVMPLPGGVFNGTMIAYPPASLDNEQPGYTLTRRVNETDPRIPIANTDWKFADCDSERQPFPGTPDATKVCLKGGFEPGYLYELVYVARDPKVMGVGLAALRDTLTFFKSHASDSAGTANPLAGAIRHTICQGTSQSGNAMKTFLHLGFNQAPDGSRVCDGMFAHVAARQTNINTRFAVPGGGGGLRTDHTAFGQTAPRALAPDYRDDLSGRTGGVMTRCASSNTCPKFFLGLSGTEFWQLQGSPVLTDAAGLRDLVQPDNARIYYYASTQHGGQGGIDSIRWSPQSTLYPQGTVVEFNDTFRALFVALEDWVVRGTEPPASQVPSVADATLVHPDQLRLPVMRGVQWPVNGAPRTLPPFVYKGLYNDFELLDFGPDFVHEDETGVATLLPPRQTGRHYAILVPQVDPHTGLTLAGIRSVAARAPLGTSLEFNYVASPAYEDLANLAGAYIPFHATEAERLAAGDTRPSLQALYGSHTGYVQAVTDAAQALVSERLLLPQDARRLIQQARQSEVLRGPL